MSTALTPLLNKFAQRYEMGATPEEVANTLKQTCFKGQVSDAQMVALLIVADQYKLNPFTIDLTKAAKTTFFAAFFLGSILAFAVAFVEVAGL